MFNKKHCCNNLTLAGLCHALGVFVYTIIVAWFMTSAEQWFGKAQGFWVPVMVLMLLVVSVVIVGVLIFGKPVMLYIDGKKKEAVKLLLYTVGFLVVITIVAFTIYGLVL